jgi:hypothetical protein
LLAASRVVSIQLKNRGLNMRFDEVASNILPGATCGDDLDAVAGHALAQLGDDQRPRGAGGAHHHHAGRRRRRRRGRRSLLGALGSGSGNIFLGEGWADELGLDEGSERSEGDGLELGPDRRARQRSVKTDAGI